MSATPYKKSPQLQVDPGVEDAAVTPSDSADLPWVTRAIYCGSGGDICLTLENRADGDFETYVNVNPGQLLGLAVKRVWATGTTATGLIAIR